MSTEFRTDTTDEWVFTRWCNGDGVGFDFGSRTRFDRVMTWACRTDETFVGEDGTTMTTDEMVQDVVTGVTRSVGGREVKVTATFGEFVGTVEVGSGEMWERCGWDEVDTDQVEHRD